MALAGSLLDDHAVFIDVVQALCPSAGKAGADTLWAAGVGVAVLPDGQPKLTVDARKNQIVGGCVVAACVAGFHRIVVKSLGQRGQAAVIDATP